LSRPKIRENGDQQARDPVALGPRGAGHGSVIRAGQCVGQGVEDKSLTEILAAPPSALAGLTERHDQILSDVFGIQMVAELGRNKHFALAGALVALSGKI
jgi:hypothetical protein